MSYAAFEAVPLPLPEDEDEDDAAARQRLAQSSAEAPASREVHARRCDLCHRPVSSALALPM